ncbi:MAG: TIGR01212 family radical SAM protein [Candidatus Marinimicrobia bacterium]|nr:TIGR01212 family radical SAM protein [Candidatus Neomarinimicrobiota bacterium]
MMPDPLPFPQEYRYYRYSHYIKQKFGQKVYRIGIDAGFTCPVRDGHIGTEGCLYCDNTSFAANQRKDILSIHDQITQTLRSNKFTRKKDTRIFFAYFQSYTNTYAPVKDLEKLYREALDFPEIAGLIIGTRPDCLPGPVLDLLQDIAQDYFVSLELGIESVYDKTLKWVNRGHDFATAEKAINRAVAKNINVSGHYILGFPTETRLEMLDSTKIINQLPLTGIKIHNLHIVKHTPLAKIYAEKPFTLFTEEEWIPFICDYLELLRSDLVIERLVGDALRDTLVAPLFPTQKTLILEYIRRELEKRNSYQGGKNENRYI